MDFRKIIQLGHNTSVISLPKRWVDQYNLSKGDALITELYGNSIIFRISEEQKSTQKEIVISISKKTTDHVIKRQLISAYENNATKIIFSGNGLLSHSTFITALVESFIGLEIIEQTTNSIVAKTYISTQEINIKTFVKRIDTSLRTAVIEFFEYFQSKDPRLVADIKQKEVNIDKLSLMMRRVIKERLQQFTLHDEDPSRLLDYWDVIKNLEKISDIVANYSLELEDNIIIESLPTQAQKARELFKKILDNFYVQNSQKANIYADELKLLELDVQKSYAAQTSFDKKHLLHLIIDISELIREINRLSY
ncbi:MAG: PhoU domain-containing protein [Candidatus Nanoarchaeia archaeon]